MGRFVVRSPIGRDVDHIAAIHEAIERQRRGSLVFFSPLEPSDVVSNRSSSSLKRAAILTAALSEGSGGRFGTAGSDVAGASGDVPPTSNPISALALDDNEFPSSEPSLPEVADDRYFNFGSVDNPMRNTAGSVTRVAARPVKGQMGRAFAKPAPWAVEARADTLMCIRRKARRGVILALGQGGGYHRPPRRSPNSEIWCE